MTSHARIITTVIPFIEFFKFLLHYIFKNSAMQKLRFFKCMYIFLPPSRAVQKRYTKSSAFVFEIGSLNSKELRVLNICTLKDRLR